MVACTTRANTCLQGMTSAVLWLTKIKHSLSTYSSRFYLFKTWKGSWKVVFVPGVVFKAPGCNYEYNEEYTVCTMAASWGKKYKKSSKGNDLISLPSQEHISNDMPIQHENPLNELSVSSFFSCVWDVSFSSFSTWHAYHHWHSSTGWRCPPLQRGQTRCRWPRTRFHWQVSANLNTITQSK